MTPPQQHSPQPQEENPEDFLASSSSDSEDTSSVRQIRINDKGSRPQCARVQVQGVPAFGIIDTGADITVIGGALFKKVATIAKLKKRDLQKADKIPHNSEHIPGERNVVADAMSRGNLSFSSRHTQRRLPTPPQNLNPSTSSWWPNNRTGHHPTGSHYSRVVCSRSGKLNSAGIQDGRETVHRFLLCGEPLCLPRKGNDPPILCSLPLPRRLGGGHCEVIYQRFGMPRLPWALGTLG